MTSLKDTLQHYGLSLTLTVRTTGQQLTVALPKGQTEVPVGLSVGPFALNGHLRLVPVSVGDGDPDLKLVLDIPVRELKTLEKSPEKTSPVGEGKTPTTESTPVPESTTEPAITELVTKPTTSSGTSKPPAKK